jgi:hypothetical protein
MKKLITICVVATVVFATSSMALATVYTVGPADLSADLSTGFSWDVDMDAPVAVSNEGTVGGNSFRSNVSGVAPTKYAAFRFVPQAVGFSADASMNDITSFTYDTKLLSDTGYDWRVSVYTKPATPWQQSGDPWYGSRISYDYNGTPHDWATTDVFAEGAYRVAVGGGGDYYSNNSGFADALSAALGQSIMWIDIIAGANSPHPAVDAYLDNIQMTGDGVNAQVDLVPEPATMALLGLGGLLLRKTKRS